VARLLAAANGASALRVIRLVEPTGIQAVDELFEGGLSAGAIAELEGGRSNF